MGVYNPNADMPVSCAECDTRGGSNCFLSNQLSYPDVLRRRHPDCPLVEVKAPHGDLVEREAVLNTFSTHMNRTLHFTTIRDKVPTVIEADDTCTGDSCPIHFPDEPKYDPDEFFSAERSGKWEWNDHNGYYYCSECNAASPREDQEGEYCDTPMYCHRCGAKMDLE